MPRHIHSTPFIVRPPEDLVRRQPDLRRWSIALGQKYANSQVVTEEDLKFMGGALWSVLDLQDEFDAAQKLAGAEILPIIIESGAADVQALPWETLYHPEHGFLGKHAGFTLSRRLGQLPQEAAPQLEQGPLRVLLFTSMPDDLNPEKGRLNVEEEQIQVQEALMPWISTGVVKLEMPDDGRFSTLKELLKKFQPHVLFLSGHGNFHHEPHTGEAPYGVFLFESETGDGEAIREDEIASALIGSGVQVVVLSACESGKTASDALTNGLTQHISVRGIPHVIGMRESIMDRAGIQFARALCDELAQRERIDSALQTARAAIQTPLKDVLKREAELSASAELSLGQWCLPMLLSPNPHRPLIDWDFQPQAQKTKSVNKSLSAISLPERFVGRRAEMRQYKNELLTGKIESLLITGPGGQGKTALAGKLALDLEARGARVFAWSARPENPWRVFMRQLELALKDDLAKTYDSMIPRFENDREHADFMLDLLMQQFDGHVVFFFDNLESIQNPDTLTLQDARAADWMQAARAARGLIVLATSRWALPDWDGKHLELYHANYGDFLQMAQGLALRGKLPNSFLQKRDELRRVYEVLGGNSRGLEFFGAALLGMKADSEEDAFLNSLAQTRDKSQADMSIEAIYTHLPETARKLLARLPAHAQPVPLEGMLKLGLDLREDPQPVLERLLAVSLVEAQYEPNWDVTQYQIAPLVADWLNGKKLTDADPQWVSAVADYQIYLFENERRNRTQAMTAHEALQRAKRAPEADRLALDYIVGPMTRAGFYVTLLSQWLPSICNSEDLQTRGKALNQTGKLHIHLGNYETALAYLKQSLTICQQIGDKAGEGTTLNNISQIYSAQGDYETALAYLKQSLAIQQQIGDIRGESVTLNNIANIYHAQGDYETALEYGKKDLAICQQIGDKAGEGATLNNISQIFKAQGDYETALAYLKQSLTITQQIGDKAGEAATLGNIGTSYHAQGDYETALAYLKQSLTIRQQIGDKAGEGTTLNNISQIYDAQGDYETALAYLKQSLTIMQQIGDKAGQGATLNNISQIFKAQGDYETALAYLKQSLTIMQQIGDKAGEGATLNNISQIYDAQSDYETALAYLKQSLTIRQQIGDKAGEGVTLNNIASIYYQQGDFESALDYFKQSLAIRQQIGDKAGEGTTLNNISQIYDAQGNYETALAYLKQSLTIRQQIGDIKGESVTLNNLSQILQAQGDYETALEYSKRDLAICQKIGDKAGLCVTLFNMGHMYARKNQMQEAINAWVTVYTIAKPMGEAQVLQALVKLAPTLGMPEGLEGWEQLAQRIQNGEKIEFGEREEVSQLEQIRRFVSGLVTAVREKSEDAQKYFESVSKMAVNPEASPEIQELGRVLQKYMSGIKNPDLSGLPQELAEIVQKELGGGGKDEG